MIDTSYSSREFYAALDREELAGSTCRNCGHKVIPARVICPECSYAEMEPTLFSGKGRLAAYTVIHVPPTAMAEAGFQARTPTVSVSWNWKKGRVSQPRSSTWTWLTRTRSESAGN